jgi:hypothetical protein
LDVVILIYTLSPTLLSLAAKLPVPDPGNPSGAREHSARLYTIRAAISDETWSKSGSAPGIF